MVSMMNVIIININKGKRRYSVKLWRLFTDLFNWLPVAAVIDDKILCMHGGLSPDLRNQSDIEGLPRPCDIPDSGKLYLFLNDYNIYISKNQNKIFF